MKKWIFAAVLALVASAAQASGISVTGTSRVEYRPDTAYLTAGVVVMGDTAASTWSANKETSRRLLAALAEAGVDAKDVQTSGLNIGPRYDARQERITGYAASYDVSVTVRKVDATGATVDAMIAGGANRNMSIRFGHSKSDEMVAKARLAAVADARTKAEAIAKEAGVKLGPLESLSESTSREIYGARAHSAMDIGGTAISAGQNAVSATVSATFSIR